MATIQPTRSPQEELDRLQAEFDAYQQRLASFFPRGNYPASKQAKFEDYQQRLAAGQQAVTEAEQAAEQQRQEVLQPAPQAPVTTAAQQQQAPAPQQNPFANYYGGFGRGVPFGGAYPVYGGGAFSPFMPPPPPGLFGGAAPSPYGSPYGFGGGGGPSLADLGRFLQGQFGGFQQQQQQRPLSLGSGQNRSTIWQPQPQPTQTGGGKGGQQAPQPQQTQTGGGKGGSPGGATGAGINQVQGLMQQ